MSSGTAEFTTNIVTKEQLQRATGGLAGRDGFLILGGAVTAQGTPAMAVDVAAVAANSYKIADATGAAVVAASVSLSASDSTNPRIDLIVLASGAFTKREGTPAADPVPGTLQSGDLELAQVLVNAGVSTITSGVITDRRQLITSGASLASAALEFVRNGAYKGFYQMPLAPGAMGTGGTYGSFLATIDSGTISSVVAGSIGSNKFTNSVSGEDTVINGPGQDPQDDLTLVGRVKFAGATSATIIVGFKTTHTTGADENDMIALRASGTGNVNGVCDASGTEGTRDYGDAGTSEFTFEIRTREAGTIVQFFRNGVQVGADITSNIPTGTLYPVVGVRGGGAGDASLIVSDMAGWREV